MSDSIADAATMDSGVDAASNAGSLTSRQAAGLTLAAAASFMIGGGRRGTVLFARSLLYLAMLGGAFAEGLRMKREFEQQIPDGSV